MVNKETEWREYEKRDITNLKENRDRNTEKRIKKTLSEWVQQASLSSSETLEQRSLKTSKGIGERKRV